MLSLPRFHKVEDEFRAVDEVFKWFSSRVICFEAFPQYLESGLQLLRHCLDSVLSYSSHFERFNDITTVLVSSFNALRTSTRVHGKMNLIGKRSGFSFLHSDLQWVRCAQIANFWGIYNLR